MDDTLSELGALFMDGLKKARLAEDYQAAENQRTVQTLVETYHCPLPLAQAIAERDLETAESMARHSFTDVARMGVHCNYLRGQLEKLWSYRPLPIRPFLTNHCAFAPPTTGGGKVSRKREYTLHSYLVQVGDEVAVDQPLFKVYQSSPVATKVLTVRSSLAGRVAVLHSAAGVNLNPNSLMVTFEGQVPIQLHDHQLVALKWLKNRETDTDAQKRGICGGLIKLEMGLGKTLLSIAHSLMMMPSRAQAGDGGRFPTLIVTAKLVMTEWMRSGFHKFFKVTTRPHPRYPHGEQDETVSVLFFDQRHMSKSDMNTITRGQVMGYDFVMVTYDTVASACKRGKFHECILEMDTSREKPRLLSVHPRTRAQSDDASAVGPAILFKTPWERVIADESTRFVNHRTKTFQYMMAIYGRFKYCLSGSPVVNESTDLWSQLRFCGYTGCTKAQDWAKNYEEYIRRDCIREAILTMNYADTNLVLPPIVRVERRVPLDQENVLTYRYVKDLARRVYDEVLCGAASYAGILKLLTRLRQICIAPYLMLPEAKAYKKTKKTQAAASSASSAGGLVTSTVAGEDLSEVDRQLQSFFSGKLRDWVQDREGTAGMKSPKMREMVRLVQALPDGEKMVIFSMFSSALNLTADTLRRFLPADGVDLVQIDGSTSAADREKALEKFQKCPRTRIMLLSTRVGAFGMNLTEANHLIFLDIWWNAVAQKQAERRLYRPGQTRPVHVYTLLSEKPVLAGENPSDPDSAKTVEDRILELCREKDDLATELFNNKQTLDGDDSPGGLTMEDLVKLFK